MLKPLVLSAKQSGETPVMNIFPIPYTYKIFFSGVVVKCTYSSEMQVIGSSSLQSSSFLLDFRQKKGTFESRSYCGVLKPFTDTSLNVELMHFTMC